MHRAIALALLFCGAVPADQVEHSSQNWKQLRGKNLEMGISGERVDRVVAECRKAGLTVAEAEELFCPVYAAHDEQLPTECLFLKIEEGLAKGVDWRDVHKATDRRLECLRQADGLVMAVRSGRGGQHQHLVMHVCMAMESGLSADVFAKLFSRPGGFRYGRLIHVVEAGESLKLEGLTDSQVLHVMNDCLDRNLTGAEVFRMVDVFQEGFKQGKDYDTIHATLWVSPSSTSSDR